jgi:O-antigen/teichoic acid export membrane protein
MLFGKPIFAVIFGSEWGESGRLAGILAAASLARSSTAWLDRIFDIRAKQHLALGMEALFAILALAAMYVVLRQTHDVDAGVTAYVIATVIYYVLWMMVALRIAPFPSRITGHFLTSMLLMIAVMMGLYRALLHFEVPLAGQFAGTALAAAILSVIALRHTAARLTQPW